MKPSTDTVLYRTTLPIRAHSSTREGPSWRVGTGKSCRKSIGWQRPAVERMAGVLTQKAPPDVEVAGRRQPRERPELVAEGRLVVVVRASRDLEPVDRPGGIDREHRGGEAIGAGEPLWRDADDLLESLCQMRAADAGRATLRSPIATAPVAAAMTLLVWRTSPRPAGSPTRRIRSSSSSISISCGPAA